MSVFKTPYMDKESKILSHADDCTLPLANEISENALDTINTFGKTDVLLNVSKAKCIALGPLKLQTDVMINGITVSKSAIKCLGI